MKNLTAFLFVMLFATSCQKELEQEQAEQLPPEIKIELVEGTASPTGFNSTTGVPIEITYKIRFRIVSHFTVYFTHVPTPGPHVNTTGTIFRQPNSYTVEYENTNSIDSSMGDMTCAWYDNTLVQGSTHLIAANKPAEFTFTGVLKSPLTHNTMYRLVIREMVFYSDLPLRKFWRYSFPDVLKTPYQFIE
jgi:hypothetical protein